MLKSHHRYFLLDGNACNTSDYNPNFLKQTKKPIQDTGVEEASTPPDDQGETDGDLAGQIETIMSELEEAAQEHPSLALLAAFGIGVFVGQLLSRR